MTYYDFLETGISRAVHRIPTRVLYAIASGASGLAYVLNIGRVRSELTQCIGEAIGTSRKISSRIGKAAHAEAAKYYTDLGFLMHANPETVQKRIRGLVAVKNREALQNALAQDRGIFLVSAHFSCFYYSLFADLPEIREVTLIRRFDSPGRRRLIAKLSQISGKQVEGILMQESAAFKILKTLKRKGLVACMLDYYYEDTAMVVSDFFGKPAATPATVAALAAKSGALLLPAFIVRSGNGYTLEFSEHIDPARFQSEQDTSERIFRITSELNQVVCQYIRKYPEQWGFWRAVPRRWQHAEIALSEIDAL